MRSVTTGFASLTFYATSRLVWQDKWKSLPKVGGNLFGIYLLGKMLIQLIPEYLSYYQTDFHPAKHDYTKLVNYWKARMADEYGMISFQEETVSKIYS